jgi:hypothetical protein
MDTTTTSTDQTTRDRTMTCEDCASPFIWTAGQQVAYALRSYLPPKRCEICRERRRIERWHR